MQVTLIALSRHMPRCLWLPSSVLEVKFCSTKPSLSYHLILGPGFKSSLWFLGLKAASIILRIIAVLNSCVFTCNIETENSHISIHLITIHFQMTRHYTNPESEDLETD